MDRIHTSQTYSVPGTSVLNAIHESNLTHADSKIKSGIEKSVKKNGGGSVKLSLPESIFPDTRRFERETNLSRTSLKKNHFFFYIIGFIEFCMYIFTQQS